MKDKNTKKTIAQQHKCEIYKFQTTLKGYYQIWTKQYKLLSTNTITEQYITLNIVITSLYGVLHNCRSTNPVIT